MGLRINDIAPDFTADSTAGTIRFHDWIGNHYAVIFSHPKDFTPVCTTELAAVAQLEPEFAKRNTRVICVSVDTVEEHLRWQKDLSTVAGVPATFPIIDDTSLNVAKLYDMLPAEAYLPDGRTPAHTATVRTVYIIGPDKKIRAMLIYPMSIGRNFDEILRTVDAVQATDGQPLSTPSDWNPGEKVIVAPALDNTEAEKRFGQVEQGKVPYIRYVAQPQKG